MGRSIITGERWRGTVGTLSQQCARLDARTRSACDEIHALRRERAAAKEVESLEALAGELRGGLAALRDQGNSLAPDPLAEFYTWLTRGFVDSRDVGFGFPLFFALLIEAVSAFGPVTIAAYADASKNPRSGTLPRAMTRPGALTAGHAATCDADVLLWIAERAVPVAGNRGIGLAKLYVDYAAWCGEHEFEAASSALFERAFDAARQLPELSGQVRRSLLWNRSRAAEIDRNGVGYGGERRRLTSFARSARPLACASRGVHRCIRDALRRDGARRADAETGAD